MIRTFLKLYFLISIVNAELRQGDCMYRLKTGLRYFKNEPILNVNATLNLVIADAEFIYLKKSATLFFAPYETKEIEEARLKLKILIDKLREAQPNEYAVENLFYAEDWVEDGDYRFDKGRVSGPESTKSIEEIYGRSLITDEACNNQLYANRKSDEARSCGISQDCMDKMTDTSDEGAIEPTERVKFLSSLRYLECTENPENSFDIIKDLCNLIYKQVLKLATEFKSKKAYFYMEKVLLCGKYGFAEFYEDNIIQILLKQQMGTGSFGKGTDLEKQVLTSQFIAIFSSMYRLKYTTNY